jgi:hypothetical protein
LECGLRSAEFDILEDEKIRRWGAGEKNQSGVGMWSAGCRIRERKRRKKMRAGF